LGGPLTMYSPVKVPLVTTKLYPGVQAGWTVTVEVASTVTVLVATTSMEVMVAAVVVIVEGTVSVTGTVTETSLDKVAMILAVGER